MQLSPEEIKKQNFELIERVKHSELVAFSSRNIWNSIGLKSFYILIVLLLGALTMAFIFQSDQPAIFRILLAGLGFAISIILIPFHEFIHILVYKYLGAKNIKVIPYINHGYVLTKADQFVVDKNRMTKIALAPFFVISAIGIIILFFLTNNWQIVVTSAILFHTSLCYSDFRILDYFFQTDSEIYMYDDVLEETSYFYKNDRNVLN